MPNPIGSDAYADRLRGNGVYVEDNGHGFEVRQGRFGADGYHRAAIRQGGIEGQVFSIAPAQAWIDLTLSQVEAYFEAFTRFLLARSGTPEIEGVAANLADRVEQWGADEARLRREKIAADVERVEKALS